jgi:photosystem II stability/assembly factor-like uncharacterized protein
MKICNLALLLLLQFSFACNDVLEFKASSPVTDSLQEQKRAKAGTLNIAFRSIDGGQTWQNLSEGLPAIEQPINFFAGESYLYLHVKDAMYRSKSNLETPVWEKENVPDLKSVSSRGRPSISIAFNHSGDMVYNYDGQIYQKTPTSETWMPIHTNFKKQSLLTAFETPGGTVFLGYDHGLYKSTDKRNNWKKVQNGLVYKLVESEGVLLAAGANGIMRSTDNGESWDWVIKEDRRGFVIESIKGGFAVSFDKTRSDTRRVQTSYDGGKTWQPIDGDLPESYSISSIIQVGENFFCSHPAGIFRSADKGKTWKLLLPSIKDKVFNLCVSGNVIYAIPRNRGC